MYIKSFHKKFCLLYQWCWIAIYASPIKKNSSSPLTSQPPCAITSAHVCIISWSVLIYSFQSNRQFFPISLTLRVASHVSLNKPPAPSIPPPNYTYLCWHPPQKNTWPHHKLTRGHFVCIFWVFIYICNSVDYIANSGYLRQWGKEP